MKSIFLKLFLVLSFSNSFAQQDGFWDKERATTKEITVRARNRIVVATEELPIGTTEIVFRITLLDQNQQLASSLTSVLKAIPDPTGISQGSAGAVFILSKISGNDKCKYAIFTSNEAASNYKEDAKTDKACFFQKESVSKDAKRLSINNSICISDNSNQLWFGFESKNWILNQRIILEIVPWVDFKLSRGWKIENRKTIIDLVKTSDLAKKMIDNDDFSLCILEKMQKKYQFQEYQKLMAIEKSKAFKDFGNECLTDKNSNKTILNNIRTDANLYFKQKKYSQAIDLLLTTIIENNNSNALDCNALGIYYIYSKQFQKAIQILTAGEKLNSSELLIQLNLAHAYLLNGNYREAKRIHHKFKFQNVTAIQSWRDKAKNDFEDFKKAGINSDDFKKIVKYIEN